MIQFKQSVNHEIRLNVQPAKKMKDCETCKHRQHPEWATGIPGYMICAHPNAGTTGRLDIQRLDDNHCGRDAKWWESADDTI